jgi:hypothetical protein
MGRVARVGREMLVMVGQGLVGVLVTGGGRGCLCFGGACVAEAEKEVWQVWSVCRAAPSGSVRIWC